MNLHPSQKSVPLKPKCQNAPASQLLWVTNFSCFVQLNIFVLKHRVTCVMTVPCQNYHYGKE